jgi:hypothetical protein
LNGGAAHTQLGSDSVVGQTFRQLILSCLLHAVWHLPLVVDLADQVGGATFGHAQKPHASAIPPRFTAAP